MQKENTETGKTKQLDRRWSRGRQSPFWRPFNSIQGRLNKNTWRKVYISQAYKPSFKQRMIDRWSCSTQSPLAAYATGARWHQRPCGHMWKKDQIRQETELTCQSRRWNLLLFRIKETEGENCHHIVQDVLKNNLQIPDQFVDIMPLCGIHWLGKK